MILQMSLKAVNHLINNQLIVVAHNCHNNYEKKNDSMYSLRFMRIFSRITLIAISRGYKNNWVIDRALSKNFGRNFAAAP